MRTIVLGERPPALEAMIEHRRRIGADLHDEVWEGEYHMAPAPSSSHGRLESHMTIILGPIARRSNLVVSGPCNIGQQGDYRVPDLALYPDQPPTVWLPTVSLVVEVLSPDDETWVKLGFYAAHRVDEVVVVDTATSSLTWLARTGVGYEPVTRSALLDVAVDDVAAAITWPTR